MAILNNDKTRQKVEEYGWIYCLKIGGMRVLI